MLNNVTCKTVTCMTNIKPKDSFAYYFWTGKRKRHLIRTRMYVEGVKKRADTESLYFEK